MTSSKDLVLVAVTNGVHSGFVHAIWSGGPYELLGICVEADFRRLGIGLALLTGVLSRLKEQSSSELWLEVRSENLAAQSLYLNTGAKHTGVRKNYYADGADALLMSYNFSVSES